MMTPAKPVSTHQATNEWFHAFLLALVMLATPWLTPGTWGLDLLLPVYGTSYSLAHSIWVHHLEWVGDPDDFAVALILAVLVYTAVFRYSIRLGRKLAVFPAGR